MGLRLARQRKFTSHPRVNKVAADQIADPIIGEGRIEQIADLQPDHEHANCQSQLEKAVPRRRMRSCRRQSHICSIFPDQMCGALLRENAQGALRSA